MTETKHYHLDFLGDKGFVRVTMQEAGLAPPPLQTIDGRIIDMDYNHDIYRGFNTKETLEFLKKTFPGNSGPLLLEIMQKTKIIEENLYTIVSNTPVRTAR